MGKTSPWKHSGLTVKWQKSCLVEQSSVFLVKIYAIYNRCTWYNPSTLFQALSAEQRVISLHAAHCTVSSMRMQKRLIIAERIFEALSRCSMDGTRTRKKTVCKSENEVTDTSPAVNPVDNFAKLGARAGLSFAFAFLKKTWRCGMNSYLYIQQNQEALHTCIILWLYTLSKIVQMSKWRCWKFNWNNNIHSQTISVIFNSKLYILQLY